MGSYAFVNGIANEHVESFVLCMVGKMAQDVHVGMV